MSISVREGYAVTAASALLSAAPHDALPVHELACAALAMLETQVRSLCSTARTDAAAAGAATAGVASPAVLGWLQDTLQLLGDIFSSLAEAGELAAIAEPAAAMLCSTIMLLSTLPATQQVRSSLLWPLTIAASSHNPHPPQLSRATFMIVETQVCFTITHCK